MARGISCLVVAIAGCGSGDRMADALDAAARVPNVTSVVVRQDGQVVSEQFFHGSDRATLHDVRSVTKTVTSLLVGNAMQAGCLTSLDQTLGALLGDMAPSDPAKAAITLRDVLTMSTGLDWLEDGASGDYNAWAVADNQVAFVLAMPLGATPGLQFNYDSGALHLASVAITHACGPTLDFAAAGLFAGLGITSRMWETDHQGNANGAAGLQLSSDDLVQLGELIRSGGGGLVPADYLRAMTDAQLPTGATGNAPASYGYGIWVGSLPGGDAFSLAEGYGGQFIAVVPARRAVVAATTDWQGLGTQADDNYAQLYRALVDDLLPAL